ncbi:TrmO family methyltransferase [Eubacteriales bacterium OttesenSCG-928-M02]|nr:TrmO family methyltransferase [Eubacteriales bacterium OttesenSCG-928-M02]
MDYTVKGIGKLCVGEAGHMVVLDKAYIPCLKGLQGFGYLNVLWWFSFCDDVASRQSPVEENPYQNGPAILGAFATRSPRRPNPIALSCAQITYLDEEAGVIGLAYIDAADGSPVLDIKPYTPSLDRVAHPTVPEWCAHWPQTVEASGDFDWAAEFNF